MIVTRNPYNGAVLKQYRELNEPGIDKKIDSAQQAYREWSRLSITDRAALILEVKNHLLEKRSGYAALMAMEMGKPVSQGVAELEKCAWLCEYYAENAAQFLEREEVLTDARKSFVTYEPLGVLLAVMPWNYPFWQVFRFAVPALLAGNTALLKHASNVMGCAEAIEEIFRECGFPEGVFQNLAIGSAKVEYVLRHKAVKAVSLTGSEMAGKAVAEIAGSEVKPSLLELGGSNAFIVLEDADLERAAEVAVNARYQNTGQSCIAAKRLLLHKNIADQFLERYLEKVAALKNGDPKDPDTYIGVMAREDLAIELEDQLKRSLDQGAELLLGGQRQGAFFEPTVVKTNSTQIPIMKEETFGPLMCAYIFEDLDQAIEVSNSTGYGLGVTVFTSNPEGVLSRSYDFEEGALFINELVKSDPRLPFGGVKNSGYGRELGRQGIRAFVNVKTVYIGV